MRITFGIIIGVCLLGFVSLASAQPTLELIRKIKVDDDGPAGASDGCQFNRAGDIVAAMRGPGEWQQYDIIFRPLGFKEGEFVEPARVTVFHNGILVQINTEILGPTAHRKIETYAAHEGKLPLAFKGERSPVEFRNIWIRDLSK